MCPLREQIEGDIMIKIDTKEFYADGEYWKKEETLGRSEHDSTIDLEILEIIEPGQKPAEEMDITDEVVASRKTAEFLVWLNGMKIVSNVLGNTGKINGEALQELQDWILDAKFFYNAEYKNIFFGEE